MAKHEKKVARQVAAYMVALVKGKRLHDYLDCDPQADEFRFGGSAELYYDSVLIMVHPSTSKGMIRFSPVPPPDDANLVPRGTLKGFSAPEDFDVMAVSKKIRALCREVRAIYDKLGVTSHIYEDEFDLEESIKIDCATDRIIGDDEEIDPTEGAEWKNGTAR